MRRWQFYTLVASCAAVLVAAPILLTGDNQSLAQTTDAPPADDLMPEPPPLPAEFVDPAFEQYVSPFLLIAAFDELDAALMTDIALQLAEGERVLLREHTAGSSADMFKMAIKVATETNNTEALDRMAKAAEAHGNQQLAADVAAAKKLAGASRADDSPKVSLNQLSPGEHLVYADILRSIHSAGLVGDADALTEFEKNVDSFEGLTDEQKAYLKKVSVETRESMGEAGDNRLAQSFQKLDAQTRGNDTQQIIGQVFSYLGQLSHNPIYTHHGGHQHHGGHWGGGHWGGGHWSGHGSRGHWSGNWSGGHWSGHGSRGHWSGNWSGGNWSGHGSRGHWSGGNWGGGNWSRGGRGHWSP